MKIVYIATYPPRECGIGTFTQNKLKSISHLLNGNGEQHEGMVIAISDSEKDYDYPPEVEFVIRQEQQADYMEAAAFINRSGADICILEHEFGIFGGQNGVYILPLLYRLEIPLLRPADEAHRVVDAAVLVARIVPPGPVRAGDLETEFLLVHVRAG